MGEKVQKALDGHSLQWRRYSDGVWTLYGECPHCGDYMDPLIPVGEIIIPDTIGVTRFGSGNESEVEIEVVGNCTPDKRHQAEIEGGTRFVVTLPIELAGA